MDMQVFSAIGAMIGVISSLVFIASVVIVARKAGLGMGGTVIAAILVTLLGLVAPLLYDTAVRFLGVPGEWVMIVFPLTGLLSTVVLLVVALVPWPATRR